MIFVIFHVPAIGEYEKSFAFLGCPKNGRFLLHFLSRARRPRFCSLYSQNAPQLRKELGSFLIPALKTNRCLFLCVRAPVYRNVLFWTAPKITKHNLYK